MRSTEFLGVLGENGEPEREDGGGSGTRDGRDVELGGGLSIKVSRASMDAKGAAPLSPSAKDRAAGMKESGSFGVNAWDPEALGGGVVNGALAGGGGGKLSTIRPRVASAQQQSGSEEGEEVQGGTFAVRGSECTIS